MVSAYAGWKLIATKDVYFDSERKERVFSPPKDGWKILALGKVYEIEYVVRSHNVFAISGEDSEMIISYEFAEEIFDLENIDDENERIEED